MLEFDFPLDAKPLLSDVNRQLKLVAPVKFYLQQLEAEFHRLPKTQHIPIKLLNLKYAIQKA